MDFQLSDAEKVFIIHGAQEGFRTDGRSCGDYRPIWLERGVLATTDGSARVRIGDTDIIAGVKAELVQCEDSSLEKERLVFNVDCSANATPQFIGKGGEELAEELADALAIAYSNDEAIPELKKLTVSNNHFWRLYIDVVILQYGGTIVDAASIGVKAALFDTQLASLVTRRADEKKMTVELPEGDETWTLDVTHAPIIVSVSMIGSSKVVDASIGEETCSFSSLWLGFSCKKEESIVTLCRQTGGGSLDSMSLDEMIQDTNRVLFMFMFRPSEDNKAKLGVEAASKVNEAVLSRLATDERGQPGQSFL